MTTPTNPDPEEVLYALERAIELLRHQDQLLHGNDEGQQRTPKDVNDWIARLRKSDARARKNPDPWQDPMVKEAINDGRRPNDIRLIPCPLCYRRSYWNEGSHFTCSFCNRTFEVTEELAGESMTLDDCTQEETGP